MTPAAELSADDAQRLRVFERHGHNLLATSYNDFFTPITSLATGLLLESVRFRSGMHLLDVATGPGSVAASATKLGARAVGVDLSPRMVELARQLHPSIEFQEADVEHLPFADDSFDAVVCSFALGHFPYPEISVTECIRTLKPGGRIGFAWWDHPTRQRIQGIFRETIAEIGVAPPPDVPGAHDMFRFSETPQFLQLLRGVGLDEVAIEEHATTYHFPDTETLWQGGLGSFVLSGAAIRCQDKVTQQRLRAAFDRRASIYITDTGLEVPIAFKIGSGRKPS
jgi:SAM-dependent methyltransferase